MANGVVGIDLEHERQIALLQVPDAIRGQHLADLFDKGGRRFQVIKHGNRADDFRLGGAEPFLEVRGGKEIHHQIHAGLVIFAEFFRRRVHAQALAGGGVESERSAVIAADIEHNVPGLERTELLQTGGFLAQVLHHGLVQTGTITISRAVQHGRRKIMMQLHQPAAPAFHQLQRRAGQRCRGILGEDSRERLAARSSTDVNSGAAQIRQWLIA